MFLCQINFIKMMMNILEKLSNIMSAEYKTITKNNLHLQLDCPDLALATTYEFQRYLSEEDFLQRAEKQIEALNACFNRY